MKASGLAASILLSAISALYGCGGGSDSAGDAAATVPNAATSVGPAEPSTTYLANGEGGIHTTNVAVDASGDFAVGGISYRLQPGGASGCTITSSPADPAISACNVLADGKAFLLCRNTLSPYYAALMVPQAETQAVTYWEVANRTFAGITCGASGVRGTGFTFQIFGNGGAFEQAEYGSSSYGPGTLDNLERTTTCVSAQFCQRLVIYRVGTGPRPHYFLAMLWQIDPSFPPRVVRLYYTRP